jgi:F-type H+-transporting ATPase subunit gamma
MATLRAIRRKITSAKKIQQITKAMYMVSAAKLRRAQQEAESTRPFASALDEIISRLLLRMENKDHPLLLEREEKHAELVLMTSDRGLCGAFNDNLIRSSQLFMEERKNELESVSLYLVGKKAVDFYKKRSVKISKASNNPQKEVGFDKAKGIADELVSRFMAGESDSVYLLYPMFHSPVLQKPTIVKLLPIQPRAKLQLVGVDYIYEPDQAGLLNMLLPWLIRMQVFRALLETRASELGARMSAMDLATQNSEDMISNLTLKMNRARQESITKELLDIVTGTEALKK